MSSLLASKETPAATEGREDTTASKGSDELVFIGEGFPPLTAKVVQKIEKGEYVDFTDLLPKRPMLEENPLTELAENGIVVLTHSKQVKAQKKPIRDIATWVEAFMTFAAVRNRKHPEHNNDLLAYGSIIVQGARDHKTPGWLTYDYQFRRLAAARGCMEGWGKKDVALWNDTVYKPISQDPTPGSSSSGEPAKDEKKLFKKRGGASPQAPGAKKPKSRERSWKDSVCYSFSYGGKCTKEKCEFLHVCYRCGEGHPQINCPKKDN